MWSLERWRSAPPRTLATNAAATATVPTFLKLVQSMVAANLTPLGSEQFPLPLHSVTPPPLPFHARTHTHVCTLSWHWSHKYCSFMKGRLTDGLPLSQILWWPDAASDKHLSVRRLRCGKRLCVPRPHRIMHSAGLLQHPSLQLHQAPLHNR